MMKFYKFMFLNMMMIGTLISISSYSWFSMWMGLEINLLSIIPLMTSYKNSFSSESAMKYFITQAMASILLLFSFIILMSNEEFLMLKFNPYLLIMINSSFLTKMGAAPFHFWFPEVINGLSWLNCLILLIWQKIAPMILLNYTLSPSFFINSVILISSMIGGIMGLNQTSLRKILAYSSINHMSWMISSMLSSLSSWFLYFFIYSLISINLILIFNTMNSFHIKQFFNSINHSKIMKMFLIMNFLSLGGLPPFLGFLPKWIMVNFLINNNYYFTSMMIILFTLITLFFYLRITFSTMMINKIESILLFSQKSKFWIMFFNSINILSLLLNNFLFNLN